MGQVSKKLRNRFGKLASRVKQQMAKEVAPLRPPKGVKDVPTLVKEGHDPIHSVYVHVQNITSVFAENVSVLPELRQYYKIVEKAEDEYLPAGPPMSPLTRSYFTTWAFFDVRFGPDKETMGTCLIDLADLLDMDPRIVEATREFQQSRMGIYEHLGSAGGRCRLRELITDREFVCYCTSGYVGRPGELWYVRVCPPLWGLADYWVTVTTPYVFVRDVESRLGGLSQPSDVAGQDQGRREEARAADEIRPQHQSLERVHLPGIRQPPARCDLSDGHPGREGQSAARIERRRRWEKPNRRTGSWAAG